MQWLQTRLSQKSFPFLLEDACQSEGLILERREHERGRSTDLCSLGPRLLGGGGCWSSPPVPQGSPADFTSLEASSLWGFSRLPFSRL